MTAGYKFFKRGGDYEFFTEYGAAYSVSFTAAGSNFSTSHPIKDFVYRMDLVQTLAGPINKPDLLMSLTIVEIVNDFFESDNRNVLFYVCDPQDGRIKTRQRKFDYWFRLYSMDKYVRIISTIITPAVSAEVVFIFLQMNPFAYDIPIMIEEAKDSFNLK